MYVGEVVGGSEEAWVFVGAAGGEVRSARTGFEAAVGRMEGGLEEVVEEVDRIGVKVEEAAWLVTLVVAEESSTRTRSAIAWLRSAVGCPWPCAIPGTAGGDGATAGGEGIGGEVVGGWSAVAFSFAVEVAAV